MDRSKHILATLNNAQKDVLGLIISLVGSNPQRLHQLLNDFGFTLTRPYTKSQLLKVVSKAIASTGPMFHLKLSELISATTKGPYDFAGPLPISAVAGAIGSIGNLLGQKGQNKRAKIEANSQTIQSLLQYKMLQEQRTYEQQKAINNRLINANQPAEKKPQSAGMFSKGQLTTFLPLAVVVLAIIYFMFRDGQTQPSFQPVTTPLHV